MTYSIGKFASAGLVAAVMTCTLVTDARAQAAPADPEAYLAYLSSLAANAQATPAAVQPRRPRGSASTVGIPSGYTLGRNSGFIAGALSNVRERTGGQSPDGSLAFGMGFGDPVAAVGFEAIVGVSSIGGGTGGQLFDLQDFGDSGSLNLKASRQVASPFSGGVGSLAVGVGRLARWGDMAKTDPNYYAAYSSSFSVGSMSSQPRAGLLTVGYGSAIGTSEDVAGGFIGVGLSLNDWLSAGASWYGNEAVVGVTALRRLKHDQSLQIGLSYSDVFQQNTSGRWTLSIALIDGSIF